MTISTFADLRTEIASWLNRTDLTTAQLSQFVTLAESDIRNDLEVREKELTTTGTMVSDGFTPPSGYLHVRTLIVNDIPSRFLPPEEFQVKVNSNTPGYYTTAGNDIKVSEGNGATYDLRYVGGITALSADGDSNWVLANAPEIYLWCGVKYGSVFLKDVQGAVAYDTLYKDAYAKLNWLERQAKYSGPMVVTPA